MAEDRLERLVRAAMRGFMEAVLAAEAVEERPVSSPVLVAQSVSEPEEMPFPSVTAAEETLFGETPPPTFGMTSSEVQIMADMERHDIDAALAARARARAYAEQNLQPQHQGGPGEKDVAEWLRLPQQ